MPQLVRIDRQLVPISRRTGRVVSRAWRRTRRRTESLLGETAYRVRRRPFRAVGLALGLGSAIGLTVAWLGHRD